MNFSKYVPLFKAERLDKISKTDVFWTQQNTRYYSFAKKKANLFSIVKY